MVFELDLGCKMLCERPYRKGIMEYGCGGCLACKKNRARMWIARMLLEYQDHEHASFVTLTYSEEFHPSDGNLRKRDVQLFLKRLRKAVAPRQLRYYAVGEYGGDTLRPHYHLVIFGLSPLEEKVVEECWPCGFVVVGTAEERSMAYVAGYVTKKFLKKDPRIRGLEKEFTLMSTKPGLGAKYAEKMSIALEGTVVKGKDVNQIRFGKNKYPLGRYLKDQLNDARKISKESRDRWRRENILRVAAVKYGQTTKEYEARRKSRVSQQTGRIMQKGTL